jgi:8-oxo-dGTP diphosphatase
MTDFKNRPHPTLACDIVLVAIVDGALQALLIKRDDPARVGGEWSLPGGVVSIDESLPDCAARVMAEKLGVTDIYAEQLASFSDINRDPRSRVVSVAYLALCEAETLQQATERDDLQLARITVAFDAEQGGTAKALDADGKSLNLAFDHADILGVMVARLRGKLDYTPLALEFLPPEFTLRDVQEVHEAILARPLTKPAFRRKLLDRGWIAPTGTRETASAFRPAELYKRKTPRKEV